MNINYNDCILHFNDSEFVESKKLDNNKRTFLSDKKTLFGGIFLLQKKLEKTFKPLNSILEFCLLIRTD